MPTKTKASKEKNIIDSADEIQYVRFDKEILTKEGNEALKRARIIEIPLSIIKVWIRRHIFLNYPCDDEYGISTEENEVVVWFKYPQDMERFNMMIEDIKEHGYPRAL